MAQICLTAQNLNFLQQNKVEVELVRAELFTVVNFDMSCKKFVNYARPKSKQFKTVRSTEKYNFK